MDVRTIRQRAFTEMMRGLWKQGKPAIGSQGECRYRMSGLKCAVGMLIPDENYRPIMEGMAVADIMAKLHDYTSDDKFTLYEQEWDFLRDVQATHDSLKTISPPAHWEDDYKLFRHYFEGIPRVWNVRFPTLEELNANG